MMNSHEPSPVHSGFPNRLHLIVVPVLEDDAPSASDYQALLWPTMNHLEAIEVRYRRNPNGAYHTARRVTSHINVMLPYELHTTAPSVSVMRQLRERDVVNNDGCFVLYPSETDVKTNSPSISISAFRRNQRAYTRGEMNSLLWRKEFTGSPHEIPPLERAPLKPFADPEQIQSPFRTLQAR